MIRSTLTAAAAALATMGMTATASADTDPLTKYVGTDRPIVIFAPDRYDDRLIEQKGRFSIHRREFRDRDVIVIEIGGPFMRAEGRGMPHGPKMRQRFGIGPDDFAIVLLGKDGSEKHRLDAVTDPQVFYELIDAMPLRRKELGLE